MDIPTLEIAASLSDMNLGAKPIEVSTDIESVSFDDNTIYIVCVDGEALSYTHSLETVTRVLEVIARAECKRIQTERGEGYEVCVRKDKEDGTKFTITEMQLGRLWNGAMVEKMVLSAYPISHARINVKRAVLTTTEILVESSIIV